jgi:tyrosyl-DNA phosphodiesterase 2
MHFGRQAYITVTLLSRRLSAHLGNIWRVALPSRFDRDASFCDIFVSNKSQNNSQQRPVVRLVNGHLDSLPIHPSFRPRQLSIVTKYLETAGRGIVAGDFNPFLPDNEAILSDNGLIDSWTYLYSQEAGATWGYLNDKPFPPKLSG